MVKKGQADLALLARALQNAVLDRVLGDQPVHRHLPSAFCSARGTKLQSKSREHLTNRGSAHADLFFLAQSMGAVHGLAVRGKKHGLEERIAALPKTNRCPRAFQLQGNLLVDGRVPVAVVEDDRVGGRQVDAQPTRTRAEQEHEDVGSAHERFGEKKTPTITTIFDIYF